jgi:hypothetical protein
VLIVNLAKVLERLKRLGIENNWIGRYLSGKSTYIWNCLQRLRKLEEMVCVKEDPMKLFDLVSKAKIKKLNMVKIIEKKSP